MRSQVVVTELAIREDRLAKVVPSSCTYGASDLPPMTPRSRGICEKDNEVDVAFAVCSSDINFIQNNSDVEDFRLKKSTTGDK